MSPAGHWPQLRAAIEAVASKEGRLRFKADSPEALAIVEAEKSGLPITVVES